MTIIDEENFEIQSCKDDDQHCDFCDGPLFPPYLEWHTTNEKKYCVCVCMRCCCRISRGLRRDLRQMEFIQELQKDYPDYSVDIVHKNTQKQRREQFREECEAALPNLSPTVLKQIKR